MFFDLYENNVKEEKNVKKLKVFIYDLKVNFERSSVAETKATV